PAPPAAPVAVDRTPPARDRGGRQLDNLQKQLREQIKARAGQGKGD
ncbi:MAG: hypothetical protein QOD61_1066, partial [Solirubrobacteraceae bacterium]|nr:hypothetical protein [Solirubrobacteraceae bacterium]